MNRPWNAVFQRGAPRRWVALAVLAGTLVCPAARAAGDPPGRVGRIADVQGRAWLLEAGQTYWQDALRNRPLTSADRLATDTGGRLTVQVGSTTLILADRSELQFTRLDDDRIDVQLLDGTIGLRVREPDQVREISIDTKQGRLTPRSVGLFRIEQNARGGFASTLEGELRFDGVDGHLGLAAGQRVEFSTAADGRGTTFAWSRMAQDDFDRWLRRTEAALVTLPVSPEMTGAADLDRYGRWTQAAEYGSVWVPVVSAGWAPYRYGRWAWVNPWGWTWVDDAAWGFAPFHFGRWVYWGNRWAWAPGPFVRRPVYAPALVAWLGDGSFNFSLTVGGPAVGWVPLAPYEPYDPWYANSDHYRQRLNPAPRAWPPRRSPNDIVMFSNRLAPGGMTVVPPETLTQRQPVAAAALATHDDGPRLLRRGDLRPIVPPQPMTVVAPPMPPNVTPAARLEPRSTLQPPARYPLRPNSPRLEAAEPASAPAPVPAPAPMSPRPRPFTPPPQVMEPAPTVQPGRVLPRGDVQPEPRPRLDAGPGERRADPRRAIF